MTIGRRAFGTARLKVTTSRPLALTVTSTLSPALATIGTGSKPPPVIAAATVLAARGLLTVASSPSGIVPGSSETYTRSVLVPPTTEKLARAPEGAGVGTGSETIAESEPSDTTTSCCGPPLPHQRPCHA